MADKWDAPPFPLGQTFYNGRTIDSAALEAVDLEGKEYWFEDPSATAPTHRTRRYRKYRIVRNVGAAAVLPSRMASFQATAGRFGSRIDGYTTTTAAYGKPIDEYLPAAGCPVNDLCYVLMKGPGLVYSSLANDGADVAAGDVLVAITGATSGATTSGRFKAQDLTGATSLLANEVQNAIGRALSTKLTNSTNQLILVDVCEKW